MPIVKFCSRTSNPMYSETTIQLCSLYYYKTVDNDFIRDSDEGLTSRTFHPPTPTVVTGNEIGRMTGLSIGGSGTIRLDGKAVRTTNPIPNAYVFCTSQLDSPTREHADALGYDSWYIVQHVDRFATHLAHELEQQLTPNTEVKVYHGPVSYQDEKGVDYSALPDFVRSHKSIEVAHYFLKRRTSRQHVEKVYADEQEYRFVFLPVDVANRPVPLAKDRIYVSSESVSDTIAANAV